MQISVKCVLERSWGLSCQVKGVTEATECSAVLYRTVTLTCISLLKRKSASDVYMTGCYSS